MRHTSVVRVIPAAILALATAACAEDSPVRTTSSTGGERAITPQVMVRIEGKTATATLTLDVPRDVQKIGSYTGTLRFDPVALAFNAEVEQGDGVLRVSNPQTGLIRIAGAGRTGIDPANLTAFTFTVLDPAGLQSLSFDLDELHEVSRADLRLKLRRGQAARILK
jgi:hypothetical protein